MRVTTNLLREFANISVTDEEIVHLIQNHIAEVNYHYPLENDYTDVVVAQITEKEEHPDADKLGIYKVNYGDKKDIQVVAGDKTLNVGDKVVYLKEGSFIPYSVHSDSQPIEVKKAKLRGIDSFGMLASEKELNIGNDHEKVLVLDNEAPVGEHFAKYYNLDDTIIEIDNKGLTNRGDLFGILGIARELTAVVGNPFTSPDWYISQDIIEPEETCLNINIVNDAEALCPRYMAVGLDSIVIDESPIWLKSTLIKCGINPTNNVVDITNYISILIGQPLHVFDYDKIIELDPLNTNKATINIRMAKHQEKILTLDEKTYTLDEQDLVIADSTHPIAIAGIIGGIDTEVDKNTKRIILESANFNKTTVRKTSMKLGINTQAASIFKHNLDTEQCLPAILKAVNLIKEFTPARVASQLIDIYYNKPVTSIISINPSHLNSILGIELEKEEIVNILKNLEYGVEVEGELLYATVPSWRKDIEIKEDIYEDIGRIYGFNNIELKLPYKKIKPPKTNRLLEMKKRIRSTLSYNGCYETLNYNFTNLEIFKKCNLDPNLAYQIKNSLSPELSLMRTNLLQSLLPKGMSNLLRGFENFCIYEINIPHLNDYIEEDKLPIEKWFLSLLLINSNKNSEESPYYVAKRYATLLFDNLNIQNVSFQLIADCLELELTAHMRNSINLFEPNSSALVFHQGIVLGVIGEIKNSIKSNFKLPVFTAGLDIDIQQLTEIKSDIKKYKGLPL